MMSFGEALTEPNSERDSGCCRIAHTGRGRFHVHGNEIGQIARCTVSAKRTATHGRAAPDTMRVTLLGSFASGIDERRVRTLTSGAPPSARSGRPGLPRTTARRR